MLLLQQLSTQLPTCAAGQQLDPSNQQLKQGLADVMSAQRSRASRPAAAAAGPAGDRAGSAGQLVLLVAHVVLVLSALASLQPLYRALGWQAYFLFCRTSLVLSMYKESVGGLVGPGMSQTAWGPNGGRKASPSPQLQQAALPRGQAPSPHAPAPLPSAPQVYLRHGLPPLRPFPAAIAPWMRRVAASTQMWHLMLSSMMMQVRANCCAAVLKACTAPAAWSYRRERGRGCTFCSSTH